jgi:hypothetical protein
MRYDTCAACTYNCFSYGPNSKHALCDCASPMGTRRDIWNSVPRARYYVARHLEWFFPWPLAKNYSHNTCGSLRERVKKKKKKHNPNHGWSALVVLRHMRSTQKIYKICDAAFAIKTVYPIYNVNTVTFFIVSKKNKWFFFFFLCKKKKKNYTSK